MLSHNKQTGFLVNLGLVMNPDMKVGEHRSTHYELECFDSQGNLKWREEFDNLVTTVGLNDSLDKHFKASAYTALWYVGLTSGSTFAASDTQSSHPGWTEFTGYSNATRPVLTLGSVAAGSVDNSASKAVFTINGSGNVFGAFITSGSAINGTAGILYGEGVFSAGTRQVLSGDSLSVTATLTAS